MINRFALLGYPDGRVAPGSVMVDGATTYSEVDFLPLYEPLLPFHQSGEQY